MLAGPLDPNAVLVTGVEEDRETGGVRVYVGPRYLNQYALLVSPEDCEIARHGWASTNQHVIADRRLLWPFYREGRVA